jgi:integrase
VLVKALRSAERDGLVSRNVASLVPTPRADRVLGRSLTRDQAARLLITIKGDPLEAAYVLMLMTGLRPGETLALSWADIDLDTSLLRVRRSLRREAGRLVLGEPKTPGSRRTIALPDQVVRQLRDHRQRQIAARLRAGAEWQDTDLVFTTCTGGPIDPRNFRRRSRASRRRRAWATGTPTSCATAPCHSCPPPVCPSPTSRI